MTISSGKASKRRQWKARKGKEKKGERKETMGDRQSEHRVSAHTWNEGSSEGRRGQRERTGGARKQENNNINRGKAVKTRQILVCAVVLAQAFLRALGPLDSISSRASEHIRRAKWLSSKRAKCGAMQTGCL